MVTSKTDCFFSCNSRILSSMVSAATIRVANTGRVCPILCARWMAWSSDAGFHQGSMRKMWSAACKLRPSAPALSEISKTFSEGSLWKVRTTLFLTRGGNLPSNFRETRPSRRKRDSMSSRNLTNCEKTNALLVGLRFVMRLSSFTNASIFVEVRNSRGSSWGGSATVLASAGLEREAAATSSSGPLSALASSSSRGPKQAGQPTKPLASLGASSMYSTKHLRWKTWPHCATRAAFSSTSSSQSVHTSPVLRTSGSSEASGSASSAGSRGAG
mmetsp:Transcript_67156/g.199701  ORF Transcript_67156/g.199701 Transcript_67156/m.199701 type:complete len:272 (-) Transcript_67156:331-1146(-)